MKYSSVALAFLWLALWTACERQEPGLTEKAAVTSQRVNQEMVENVSTTMRLSQQEMDAYRDKVERKIEEFEKDIASLKAKIEEKGDAVDSDVHQAVKDLERQTDSLKGQATALETASAEAWGELKTGIDEAMDELERSYEKAHAKFEA